MCFSAKASYGALVVLVGAGVYAVHLSRQLPSPGIDGMVLQEGCLRHFPAVSVGAVAVKVFRY